MPTEARRLIRKEEESVEEIPIPRKYESIKSVIEWISEKVLFSYDNVESFCEYAFEIKLIKSKP